MTPRGAPIVQFLGADADRAGPFGLLGISPKEATPARIEQALQLRLDQIDEHPQAFTPEADEVRLAVHTAAAQLLDPIVRQELLRRIVAETGPNDAENAHPSVATDPTDRVDLLSVGRASQQQHARPQAPVESIALHSRDHGSSNRFGQPTASVRRTETDQSSGSQTRSIVLFGTCAGVVALLVGIAIIAMTGARTPVTSNSSPSGTVSAASDQSPSAPELSGVVNANSNASGTVQLSTGSAPQSGQALFPVKATPFVESGGVIRDLRAISALAKSDLSMATAKFGTAVAPLADWWTQYNVGQRRAGTDAVVEILYALGSDAIAANSCVDVLMSWAKLSGSTAGSQVHEPIEPSLVNRSAWAMGMLVRLHEEAELPRPVAAATSQALLDTVGASRPVDLRTFDAGAMLALRRLPEKLPQSTQADGSLQQQQTSSAVTAFITAVTAVAEDPGVVERVLVDALERLLLDERKAHQYPAMHAAISQFVTSIKWRKDGLARARLLEWLRDPRYEVGTMHVLTSALTAKSAAEGIDATMVLSIGATTDDRIRLRAAIAKAWGLADSEAREVAMVSLRQAAQQLFDQVNQGHMVGSDESESLAQGVVGARLNQAARMIWLGDPALATSILTTTEQTMRVSLSTPSRAAGSPASQPGGSGKLSQAGGGGSAAPQAPISGDGAWAESYLQAERNITVRLERLASLKNHPSPFGRIDAGVLVENALLGSPSQVRASAQRWVTEMRDEPAIIEAVLEQLPFAPKTKPVADMIQMVARASLPRVGTADWELHARRELVARLLDLLSGESSQARVDALTKILAQSYGTYAANLNPQASPSDAALVVIGARGLWDSWTLEVSGRVQDQQSPYSFDRVSRRRQSRIAVAAGPVQVFAAEQASLAELMALVVYNERPGTVAALREVTTDLALRLRNSAHVFEQVRASEIAMLRLWLIRLGQETP